MTTELDEGGHAAAALAKGGRTNFTGFVLRMFARLPFLLLAARLYGASDLGRYAYATMVVEFVAALAVFGLKRGIAAEMVRRDGAESATLADCLLVGLLLSAIGCGMLLLFPMLMEPAGAAPGAERWLAFIIPAITLSDISLAGLAFHHRIDFAVHARSLIEPWVLTISATAFAFTPLAPVGLPLAYGLSLSAASLASLWFAYGEFGLPQGWRPSPPRLFRIIRRNLPLVGADFIEWTAHRMDVFLLGRFAGSDIVGIYYVAQQIATLAGKIRVSFDPILSPMLSVAIGQRDFPKAAWHVRQVGFWVLALQLPVVLAVSLASEGILGLFGPAFAAGALALTFLLLAELGEVMSSVSEMGLIYTRPKFNLQIGLACLMVQVAASLYFIPRFTGAGASGSLFLAILVAGIARQLLLWRAFRASVFFWRPALFLAAFVAGGAGYASRLLPELPHMLLGIPAVLILFGVIIWRLGFRDEDKRLFQRGTKSVL